jgi:hypothetical protein
MSQGAIRYLLITSFVFLQVFLYYGIFNEISLQTYMPAKAQVQRSIKKLPCHKKQDVSLFFH